MDAPKQKKVFLIDDDPDVRKTLQRGLQRRGYNVEVYKSAHEFLDAFQTDLFGCLVLDLNMLSMSGLELQQELLDRNSTIPIIFITGSGGTQQAERALSDGAIEFLEKPFPPETLVYNIEKAYEHHKAIGQ